MSGSMFVKDEAGLHRVDLTKLGVVDKDTGEFLAKMKCRVEFTVVEKEDNRGYTLQGCQLKELFRDENGDIVGFEVEYDIKTYDE
jgi:hypothetical protein